MGIERHTAAVFPIKAATETVGTDYYIPLPAIPDGVGHIMNLKTNTSGTAQPITLMFPLDENSVASAAAEAHDR